MEKDINEYKSETAFDYKFNNVGQFRQIMDSLGWHEQSNKANLAYDKESESLFTNFDDIRELAIKEDDKEPELKESYEYISQFYDINSYNDNKESYVQELKLLHGIEVREWKPKDENKLYITIIDHINKTAYAGKDFTDYAYKQGYLLDGQGTKGRKGEYTKFDNKKGTVGKVYTDKQNKQHFFKKQAYSISDFDDLHIPDKLLKKKLSIEDKTALLKGQVICIRNKKDKEIYLKIDKDINSIVVLSNKEIKHIPSIFAGHELSPLEKQLIINNKFTPPLLLQDGDKYFLAEVRITADKFGYEFKNYRSLSLEQAERIKHQQSMDIKKVETSFIHSNGIELTAEKVQNLEQQMLKELYKGGFKQVEKKAVDLGLDGISSNLKHLYNKYDLDQTKEVDKERLLVQIKQFEPNFEKELAKENELNREKQALISMLKDPSKGFDKFNETLQKDNGITVDLNTLLTKYKLDEVYNQYLSAEKNLGGAGAIANANHFIEAEKELKTSLEASIKYIDIQLEPEIKELENLQTVEHKELPKEENKELTADDLKALTAIKNEEFDVLLELAEGGYKPSAAFVQEVGKMEITEDKKVAINNILGITSQKENKANLMLDEEEGTKGKSNAKDKLLQTTNGIFQ